MSQHDLGEGGEPFITQGLYPPRPGLDDGVLGTMGEDHP
jgi:hypothetical protein